MIHYCFQYIARTLKYPNVCSFIEYHLEYLLSKWVEEKREPSSFPIQLCNTGSFIYLFNSPKDTFTAFLEKYVNILLPNLIMAKDLDNINKIATLLRKDIPELIKFALFTTR